MDPTHKDEAKQVDDPAGNATRACFARFRSCIDVIVGEHRNYLEVRLADLTLWADSVGALAVGKASLDWRLSGRSRDIFLVTSLLDMLEQFLEGYKMVAIKDGDENEIEEEIQEAKRGIDEMTDNLAWIGSEIRRSGTKSRLQKADICFERDRAGKDKRQLDQLRAHLVCIMKSRPTESARSEDYSRDFHDMDLEGIQNRLVEANLRRWHRFRYAQRHSDVLRASRAVQNMPVHLVPEDSAPDSVIEPKNNAAPRMNTAATKQRNEANDQSETRTTAEWSASGFGSEYQGLEGRYSRPAKSTMTRVSFITGSTRFPKAKKAHAQRKTLLCPCCCQALPLEETEDVDLWVKHMKNDITPYTCIVESCPTPYRFYVTQNEWREHVSRDHPPKWRCSCCTGTRPVFQSLPAFMTHLDEKHDSQVSDETFDHIMAKSAFRTFGITNCPLCNDHGPTDSPELIEHVLAHIYDFSMYALPWRTIPQASSPKPIRTFNDFAPLSHPHDDKDVTEMRMLSHTRILEWVKEPHSEEENLTSEQKATLRGLDWDDYQVIGTEDRMEPIVDDYFDRDEIDYFDDNASSRGAASQTSDSGSTRRLYTASSSGISSFSPADSVVSVRELISSLADATIVDNEKITLDKESINPMYERELQGREEICGPDDTSKLTNANNFAEAQVSHPSSSQQPLPKQGQNEHVSLAEITSPGDKVSNDEKTPEPSRSNTKVEFAMAEKLEQEGPQDGLRQRQGLFADQKLNYQGAMDETPLPEKDTVLYSSAGSPPKGTSTQSQGLDRPEKWEKAEWMHYTVAIVCALEFEMSAVRYMLDEEHQRLPSSHGDSNVYILGKLCGHNVVLACLPGNQGKSAAAIVATNLDRTFPSIIWRLFSGIGGGVPSDRHDIRLGDVVVSMPEGQYNGVVQYDLGKDTNAGFKLTRLFSAPAPPLRAAVYNMRSNHRLDDNRIEEFVTAMLQRGRRQNIYRRPRTESDILFKGDYPHPSDQPTCNQCDQANIITRPFRGWDGPEIHYGLIASGDRVMRSAVQRNLHVRNVGDILCFEMEAAGLTEVSSCIIIRGISDYADSHQNDAWQHYAAAAAAACTKELLTYLVPEPLLEESQAGNASYQKSAQHIYSIDSGT